MSNPKPYTLPLFHMPTFPSTRYQGSKNKIVDWIWDNLQSLTFETCLDAFGGTGVVAYKLKQMNKHVTYNDILRFNYHFGRAIIENKNTILTKKDIENILQKQPNITYPTVVADNFKDIYFTQAENHWIDQVITNIWNLENPYKQSLAFFALSQACIIKRPYNLFHRKNLYIRLADVERSFGNKTTWDTPFPELFHRFVREVNRAVFDNGKENIATCKDILDIDTPPFDLVYIDPPYVSRKGVGTDYRDFYHFLEGLTMYEKWEAEINYKSKHHRLKRTPSRWKDKSQIHSAFNDVFAKFKNSILVVSYRSDGIPSIDDLVTMMKRYKTNVHVVDYGAYQYALSKNRKSKEMLIIGADNA